MCPAFDALSAGLIIHATATSLADGTTGTGTALCIKYALSGSNFNTPTPCLIPAARWTIISAVGSALCVQFVPLCG